MERAKVMALKPGLLLPPLRLPQGRRAVVVVVVTLKPELLPGGCSRGGRGDVYP